MSASQAVGIDVGGSSIKAVRIDANGAIMERRQVNLPGTEPEILALIADLADDLDAGPDVGVCVPGIVDEQSGIAHLASNLPWRMSPLRDLLSEATGRTVLLGHDVRCGARAELRWGTGAATMLYVAIGTGISSVSVIAGQILPGLYAGEIGQVLVPLPGQPLVRVPVESVSSAASIARRFARAAPGVLPEGGGAKEVLSLLGTDPIAELVVKDALATLADALAFAIAVTAPTVVVIAGGLAGAGAVIVDPLTHNLREALGCIPSPEVVASPLGQFGQAMGAASLVLVAS